MQLGFDKAFGTRPEFLLSYSPFKENESHLLNYYDHEVPYHFLDESSFDKSIRADVVSAVCPCAGLSQLSSAHGTANPNNEWLLRVTHYMLEEYRPEVLVGENAPGFAGKIGDGIRGQMYDIARDNGYTMTVYRTKSLLHGNAQVRERSFFFFWKGDKTPILGYYNEPRQRIEDVIRGARGNTQRDVINKNVPTNDPFYKFILEEMYPGMSHKTFSHEKMEFAGSGNVDIQSYIERNGYDYSQVATWMRAHGFERDAKRCDYKYEKLKAGGQIMRRGVMVPHDYIGAFVSHYPLMLTHPDEDRFLNYREAMTIMGLPDSFELLGGRKNVNHICQNVPVLTARDMALEIKAVLENKRPYTDSPLVFQHNHNRKHEEFFRKSSDVTTFFG